MSLILAIPGILRCEGHIRSKIRTKIGYNAPEINESKHRKSDKDFFLMCRFIGLFRSVTYPSSYITTADDNDGTCNLKAIDKSASTYRLIEGIIWEVNASNNLLTQPLSDQLQ
ncbi:uncharacterized protein LOC126840086 [Adelges cooleyi]|uniref:uncharacterized protein LOC126835933 n=1 Tax=Adelges cooleyi TaxID=133065 RepID=UPI00217FAC41|nr:uncharacterized protein LOC126835933 [Adelges cooleyi]XP_050424782.1 uncharacterized protein LOC126835933 [Adelges cooleyi]XP_050431531.1 uncharacterized protein LOC126840086 [Adelges cooleyi]